MNNTLNDQTALVTGGTSGIGLETARALSTLGAQVTIVGRSEAKCRRATAEIDASGGSSPADFICADLSTLAGMEQAASEFKVRHAKLHLLINNAGGFFMQRRLTADGFEYTFALNHLGYFLVTNRLLDLLKGSAPARIVNVSSGAHRGAHLDFDNLQGEKHYRGMQAYGQSKLANLLFTFELARRLAGSGVTVNAVHPGFVATGFARNNGLVYALGMAAIGPFIRKPRQGAQTSIYLASSPEVEGVSGKYFVDCREAASSPESHDPEAARQLWQLSLKLTRLQP
jgi:NAD(P)-dependent dehydrogenase (short-subunit alcohol dehydrogenase family)